MNTTSTTSWSDLAPWFFAMVGVFTLTKCVSKCLLSGDDPARQRWSLRLDISADAAAGLLAVVGFFGWVAQYHHGVRDGIVAIFGGVLLVLACLSAAAITSWVLGEFRRSRDAGSNRGDEAAREPVPLAPSGSSTSVR